MLSRAIQGLRGFRRAMRQDRKHALLRAELARHGIGADHNGLLLSHGIGDHTMVMGLANAYEQALGEPLTYFVGRADLAFLAEAFLPRRTYVALPGRLRARMFEDGLKGGRLFYGHFPGYHLNKVIGYHGLTLLDAYRCRFKLPADSTPQLPSAPLADEVERAAAQLTREGLRRGKTVMLCTEARSLDSSGLVDQFWVPLVSRLQSEGFGIKVNDNPGLCERLGLSDHRLPLNEWRAMVAACGHLVSFRSGLSDLALNTGARHTVVFPRVAQLHSTALDAFPVAALEPTEEILEIEIDADNLPGIFADIMTHHLK